MAEKRYVGGRGDGLRRVGFRLVISMKHVQYHLQKRHEEVVQSRTSACTALVSSYIRQSSRSRQSKIEVLLFGPRRLTINRKPSESLPAEKKQARTIDTAATYLPKSSNARGIVTGTGRFGARLPNIAASTPESAEKRSNADIILHGGPKGSGPKGLRPTLGTELNTELSGRLVGVNPTRGLGSVPCAIAREGPPRDRTLAPRARAMITRRCRV